MTIIKIQHPGTHTTIQDLGRPGLRSMGVSPGGAVDKLAATATNWLVGNPENAAVLECALVGPKLSLSKNTSIAICGAAVDGWPGWKRIDLKAGSIIDLSRIRDGVYLYLAIAGGIKVSRILGSASTDLRVGWGGLLTAGDEFEVNPAKTPKHRLAPQVYYQPWYDPSAPIRIVAGIDARKIASGWIKQSFRISSQSDRMGLRIIPEKPIQSKQRPRESTPVFPGTIQLPPDGSPIVLLADAQTLGGYPQIGHVARVDLHRIAQIRPNKSVQFELISLETAHALARERQKQLARLKYGLQSSQ